MPDLTKTENKAKIKADKVKEIKLLFLENKMDRVVDEMIKDPKSPRNKKAKGGRAGYKNGKSVKKRGGCAIKGKSPILR